MKKLTRNVIIMAVVTVIMAVVLGLYINASRKGMLNIF